MTLFDTKLVGYFITLSVKSIRSLKRYKAGKGQHILPAHAFSMHSGDAQLRSASITKRKWTACQVWIEGTDRNPLFSSKCSQFQLKVTPIRKANQLFFWGKVKSLAQKKDVVKISTRDSLHSSVPRPFISQAANMMGKCSRPSLPSPAIPSPAPFTRSSWVILAQLKGLRRVWERKNGAQLYKMRNSTAQMN